MRRPTMAAALIAPSSPPTRDRDQEAAGDADPGLAHREAGDQGREGT